MATMCPANEMHIGGHEDKPSRETLEWIDPLVGGETPILGHEKIQPGDICRLSGSAASGGGQTAHTFPWNSDQVKLGERLGDASPPMVEVQGLASHLHHYSRLGRVLWS